jgi:cobyrinic acid a,c-diamide synthase
MNRLLISAAHKSSGKTTLSIGLCAALAQRRLKVQPFKKGPDYIDPMWLSLASGRSCHNLDFFLMQNEEILSTFVEFSRDTDIAVIEGNKGLYDGLDLDGSNSNAALAKLLATPVILVIDARGMTRGVAPLILGYQAFDRDIRIAGVILNQLGGARHERKLRAVIEHYTDVPVIGAVHHDDRLAIIERHLGLMPSNEASGAHSKIGVIAEAVAAQVDLDRLMAIAASAPALPVPVVQEEALSQTLLTCGKGDSDSLIIKEPSPLPLPLRGRGDSDNIPIKVGIARDAAFAFYYPDDLDALRRHGAELVFFDTLRDPHLPEVDALFIGGGFPEAHMQALEANRSLREEIRQAIESGLPVYAECGGLMYLSRSLRWQGLKSEMVGVIAGDTVMHERPQGRGYVKLRETGKSPWPRAKGSAVEIRAHEFHYSTLVNLAGDLEYAYDVTRGTGIDGRHDGIVYRNVLACYTHMRDVGNNHWTARFVEFVRRLRDTQKARPDDGGFMTFPSNKEPRT